MTYSYKKLDPTAKILDIRITQNEPVSDLKTLYYMRESNNAAIFDLGRASYF